MSQFPVTSKVFSATAIGLLMGLGGASQANAAAIISVDLDPGTAGIQSARTVSIGTASPLNIAIVLSDDGTPTTPVEITNFTLEALFNDNGAVLGTASNFRVGDIIEIPNGGLDFNNFGNVSAGDTIATNGFTEAGMTSFANGTSFVDIVNDGPIFSVTPGSPETLFTFDITLDAIGSSNIDLRGRNGAESLFDQDGEPLSSTLESAELTVVPEPSTMVGTGLAVLLGGLGWLWHRRRLGHLSAES